MKSLKKTLILKSNLSEMNALDSFLQAIFDEISLGMEDQERVRLGMHEAVANAIKHGNKLDEQKQVKICMMHLSSQLEFDVEDEGDGFNMDEVEDPLNPENLLKASGRGIFLMHNFADEVIYSKGGTHIKLIYEL